MVGFGLKRGQTLKKEHALAEVKEVFQRRHLQRKTCLEVVMRSGRSLVLNFLDGRSALLSFVEKLQGALANRRAPLPEELAPKHPERNRQVARWLGSEISNFEYLMYLNLLGGRSYQDLTQYPVFPWVLSNYYMDQLNLNDAATYRDLSKNMGSLGDEKRVKSFWTKYENEDPFSDIPQYHFGTHYSAQAIVFSYLLRVYPFTRGAKELQSGKFDIADRLFYSVPEAFHNATEELTDVREIIPDFFALPDCFLNLERHDFGVMQNEERVHNVKLPLWSSQDPYAFIVRHRQALESEFVSQSVHAWIDLIFGCKQRGAEAHKNMNVYFYLTYEDSVDLDHVAN